MIMPQKLKVTKHGKDNTHPPTHLFLKEKSGSKAITAQSAATLEEQKPSMMLVMRRMAIWFAISFQLVTRNSGAMALVPSSSSPADDRIHAWFDSIGVEINPSVKVLTTSASVAGRGVFAVEPLVADEKIASIPTYAMFHPANARGMFPEVADRIKQRMNCPADDEEDDDVETKRKWLPRLLRRLIPRKVKDTPIESNEEPPWQVELTEYALAALDEDHPFAPWVKQWSRDDPVKQLFEKGAPTKEDVEATAMALNKMVPDVSLYKILAALSIRLEDYEALTPLLSDTSPRTTSMFTTVTSRTIDVADDVVSVVPFHDMLNHDFVPNAGLGFSDDGKQLELFALTDIVAGDELFLSYTKIGKEYNEDAAVWMLVQWGIPVLESQWKVVETASVKASTTVGSN